MTTPANLIKSHHELAKFIEGKTILHLNSLGKDSALCLDWLCNFAKPKKVISIHFGFISLNPWDRRYKMYQALRYKDVQFITEPNGHELNNIQNFYQYPLRVLTEFNAWEHYDFDMNKHAEAIAKELGCDYICIGNSKYESVARAQKFHKLGLVQGNRIYPLGMMQKSDIINLIKATGIKLHPSYRFSQSTLDYPSYYKMRSHFIANPTYKKMVYAMFPLLALDEYRYEVLMKGKFE